MFGRRPWRAGRIRSELAFSLSGMGWNLDELLMKYDVPGVQVAVLQRLKS